jgi:hypothetical protein
LILVALKSFPTSVCRAWEHHFDQQDSAQRDQHERRDDGPGNFGSDQEWDGCQDAEADQGWKVLATKGQLGSTGETDREHDAGPPPTRVDQDSQADEQYTAGYSGSCALLVHVKSSLSELN